MSDEVISQPSPSSQDGSNESPLSPLESGPIIGRPTLYKPEYDELAYNLCLLFDATDKQLAEFFEVTEQTVNNWKIAHPSFFESLKKGKVIADAKVARSLHDRATGYKVNKTVIDNKGNEHTISDNVLPDITAQIFWLKNRQPDKWRDRHQVTIDDPDKVLAEVLNVKPEDLPE